MNAEGRRFNPPGDILCSSGAECKTCVGGPNTGKTWRAPTASINDCGTGTCTGAATCKLGSFDLEVGSSDAHLDAPVTIPQASLFLSPAIVNGIGTVCVTAANDGVGTLDCNGGRANLNTLSRRDHNTTPGDPSNFGQKCKGGTNNGMPCVTEADCPGEVCDPYDCGPGLVNCLGPDGLACTPDDTPLSPPSPVTVALSTGTNQIYTLDASNDGTGNAISPETSCPVNQCLASLTGVPATSCAAVRAGEIDGITFGGGFPSFDTTAGDIVTTFQFKFERRP